MLNSESQILVVDDQQIARTMLIKSLNGNGFFHITEAENGAQAYECILASLNSSKPISLVFSDINMPETDGLQLLEKCKTNPATEKLPIVLVTAESEMHMVVKALKSGALDYIKKPVSIDALKNKISSITQKIS